MQRRGRLVALVVAVLVVSGVIGAVFLRGSSSAAAPRAAAPTWKDVAPVFAAKCAGCHMTGGIAPFSLTSPRSAKAHAGAILAMTQRGLMPPWPPSADSPAYVGSERRILTAKEKDLIARWVRGGARAGVGGPISPARTGSTAPGRKLSLAPARSYLPHADVGGLDDYHCFVLEPRLKQNVFVTSSVIQPQRADIVHHVILFEAAGANAAEARRLDAASHGQGWTCFGGPGLTETHPSASSAASDRLGAPEWLGAWVPGHTTNDTPKATGVLLHAGAAIVLQVHYNLVHPARPDRSRAVLRVVPASGSKLTRLTTMLVAAPVELPCPSGVRSPLCSRDRALADEAKKYGPEAAWIPTGLLYLCGQTAAGARGLRSTCDRGVTTPLRIYGVAGHMHLRGLDIRVDLNPGTPGAKTLLHIPHWDFHWQDAYYLRKPVDASPGDTIRVTCRYDNSAKAQPVVNGRRLSPRYVLWGEGTTDEMCLGLLQVARRP
jgi:mono/diheme cytochrome c family protein